LRGLRVPTGLYGFFGAGGHANQCRAQRQAVVRSGAGLRARVTVLVKNPLLFAVNTKVPAKTLPEFVTYAKQNAGKMNYGSAGNGTATHLSMEMLKDAARIDRAISWTSTPEDMVFWTNTASAHW